MGGNEVIKRVGYGLEELSDCEHLAFNWLLAITGMVPKDPNDASGAPMSVAQLNAFKKRWDFHVKQVGDTVARQQLNLGLERLMEKEIVTGLKRDGHRDWKIVPGETVIHFNMLIDRAHLIEQPGKHNGLLVTDDGE